MSTTPTLENTPAGDPLAGMLSAADLHAAHSRAFAELDEWRSTLVVLLGLHCDTSDPDTATALRKVIDLVRARIPGLEMTWLLARRAWSDAAGLNLDPFHGV
ncbi:hypothetical protein [Candidatus Protofrankia californiensis]|uniref:hypothetical protein n=1 Tax=Candidatus Protofrankia californiensis TaxID=1839754 RepID=UPI0010415856|nr:hypothetical protein [Candidatus Protofrankia californiensis]